MIGKVTKRAWMRSLLKKDVKADGQRPVLNRALRAYGYPTTLFNQMALSMGFTSDLRVKSPKQKAQRS
jgi:hypothetical protein